MKFAYVLTMSGTLAFAPIAQAQITCEQAAKVMGAATEDFDSIVAEEIDDSVFETTFSLDGSDLCQVMLDFSSSYSCMWSYGTLDEAMADYRLQSHALGECLEAWERKAFTNSSGDPDTKTLDGASYFLLDDDGAENTWITFVEEHVQGEVHDWHLWLGLDYF